MAWQTIGTTDLKQTTTTLGYVYLQYDDSSQGVSRSVRLITGARSGYSFNVRFDNVTVDGDNQGTTSGVTGNGVVVWSGYVSGGRNISGSWSCPWNTGTKYYDISGYLPTGATSPSGGSITFVSSTYNSITSRSAVTNWGGLSGTLESIVVTGSANGDAASVTSSNWTTYGRINYRTTTSNMSATATISDSSYYAKVDSPISIKGLTHYKLAYWNWNAIGHTDGLDNTLRYLPPSKPSLTYSDQGSNTFRVEFTNTASDNHTTYDTAALTRTLRYKVGTGAWISIEDHITALIDDVTTFDVPLPAGSTATVEGWMTYHGMDSEKVSVQFSNAASPNALYGSVNNRAEKIVKLYGSVNGQAKEVTKLYGSVNGVAKKIYEA